jgi:hypothetical protein
MICKGLLVNKIFDVVQQKAAVVETLSTVASTSRKRLAILDSSDSE